MANQSPVIDFADAIREVADAGFLHSSITVYRDIPVQDAVGELVEDAPPNWETIIEDVACQIGVPTGVFAQRGEEIRTGDLTRESALRQVNLDDFYPIIERDMHALIGGDYWNIVSVLHDSQETRTLLLVESGQ